MTYLSIRPPSSLLLMTEFGRGALGLGTYMMSIPFLQFMARGDGHPVLVLPGMLTSDHSTLPLRFFLKSRSYAAYPWALGRNLLAHRELEVKLLGKLEELYFKYGRKVSLIGWSAGGVFARALAHARPHQIRQVITLASPFQGISKKSNIEFISEWLSGDPVDDLDEIIISKAAKSPPVPSTAIYSRADGVVSWQACKEAHEDEFSENVEVLASHIGMGHNPQVLLCIADRLSQSEHDWKPFRESYMAKTLYVYPW